MNEKRYFGRRKNPICDTLALIYDLPSNISTMGGWGNQNLFISTYKHILQHIPSYIYINNPICNLRIWSYKRQNPARGRSSLLPHIIDQ